MQKLVEEFVAKYKLQTNVETRYIDLVSEVGELGKEIIENTNYGRQKLILPFETLEMTGEIGDCLFSLLALCCEINIDAEEALRTALSKYELRFANKGNISSISSDN
jgi:NTP pyrophosphatase (non-canonical NTP hydrolase)